MSSSVPAQRVAVYIDGFNLYYGLRSKDWRRYYWLDIHSLARNILRPNQDLVLVRYFTAHITAEPDDPDKPTRQNTYIEALGTLPNVQIHYGDFRPRTVRCFECGREWSSPEEKMTDVNIAVEALGDAQDDRFDTAVVISGDSDLVGLVRALRQRYSEKRAIVAFPPGRRSDDLRGAATASFTIGRKLIADSQLPERVSGPDGSVWTRPQHWQ